MAINFIKTISKGQKDQSAHNAFVRYGLGIFPKEDLIIKKIGKKYKIYGSFEYANVLVNLIAALSDDKIKVEASIPSIKDLSPRLSSLGIEFELDRRFGKSGKLYKFKTEIKKEDLIKLLGELHDCYCLMNLTCGLRLVKFKKLETPKLGGKTDKYVIAELDISDKDKIIEEFLFDVDTKEFAEAVIKHIYNIKKINVDLKLVEKDANEARRLATRQGTIKRTVIVDGKTLKDADISFEV